MLSFANPRLAQKRGDPTTTLRAGAGAPGIARPSRWRSHRHHTGHGLRLHIPGDQSRRNPSRRDIPCACTRFLARKLVILPNRTASSPARDTPKSRRKNSRFHDQIVALQSTGSPRPEISPLTTASAPHAGQLTSLDRLFFETYAAAFADPSFAFISRTEASASRMLLFASPIFFKASFFFSAEYSAMTFKAYSASSFPRISSNVFPKYFKATEIIW